MRDSLEPLEAAVFSWCKSGFMTHAAIVCGAAQAIGRGFAIHQANSFDKPVPCDLSRKGGILADAYDT
jgi:hypothetical protein